MNPRDLMSRSFVRDTATPTARNPFYNYQIFNGEGKLLRADQIFSKDKQTELPSGGVDPLASARDGIATYGSRTCPGEGQLHHVIV